MNKFFKNIILFIPYVLSFYIILLIVWGTFVPAPLNKNLNYALGAYGHMYSRVQDVKQIKDIDILFLGSSHAYRGFDTRVFLKEGYKAFNLGSSGQTPVQTELLVKRYYNNLNPKTVVLEVYPGMFSNDGVESSLDLICNDKIDVDYLEMTFTINHIKTYNTLIYSYYRQLFQFDKSFNEPLKKGGDTYVKSGGYVEREIQTCEKCVKSVYPVKNWEFKEQQKNAFIHLINYLKGKKVKIILVWAPLSESMYESIMNKKEIDSYLRNFGEYYNFNEILEMNDSLDFYDPHHLNQRGVEKFNKYFIDSCLK